MDVTALTCVDDFCELLEAEETKGLVMDVHASWCGPCTVLQPRLQSLLNELSDEESCRMKVVSVGLEVLRDWLSPSSPGAISGHESKRAMMDSLNDPLSSIENFSKNKRKFFSGLDSMLKPATVAHLKQVIDHTASPKPLTLFWKVGGNANELHSFVVGADSPAVEKEFSLLRQNILSKK